MDRIVFILYTIVAVSQVVWRYTMADVLVPVADVKSPSPFPLAGLLVGDKLHLGADPDTSSVAEVIKAGPVPWMTFTNAPGFGKAVPWNAQVVGMFSLPADMPPEPLPLLCIPSVIYPGGFVLLGAFDENCSAGPKLWGRLKELVIERDGNQIYV